ncbi:hypothetical protein BMW23_0520 [Bodo saltans virus]|uniref:Uncharacterized protein n=1 Tax=Bodo saltans virus TaxID=2024608 RepID=A0A2H4UUN3_9VIRU|nr:hypothetical protein QJ851_gp0504 [Bodo saltans virus]ATZ80567.1 hypothetical protein BMW23_0520 [Bodo saltans virus]
MIISQCEFQISLFCTILINIKSSIIIHFCCIIYNFYFIWIIVSPSLILISH